MPQYLVSEPAEAILCALGDALDRVDFGIVLLNRDLRVWFINRRFGEMWNIASSLLTSGPTFRELIENVAACGWYDVPADDLPAFLDEEEAAVRAGSVPPSVIELADRRHILFQCVAGSDSGRILTYADISRELLHEASCVAARTNAELRFSAETMAQMSFHLATLAEASDENAQKSEAARRLLEHEVAERRQLEENLRWLATIDGLTGALNRTELLASGRREMEARAGTRQMMAVLMIDVDHFKAINDRFGHAGGDLALQQLVATLRDGVRETDLVGRMGGEEFAVLLPDTSSKTAEAVAERLRSRVAEAEIAFGDQVITMTISIGLAIQRETDRSVEHVLARADEALYSAKRGGRNRVVANQQTESA